MEAIPLQQLLRINQGTLNIPTDKSNMSHFIMNQTLKLHEKRNLRAQSSEVPQRTEFVTSLGSNCIRLKEEKKNKMNWIKKKRHE